MLAVQMVSVGWWVFGCLAVILGITSARKWMILGTKEKQVLPPPHQHFYKLLLDWEETAETQQLELQQGTEIDMGAFPTLSGAFQDHTIQATARFHTESNSHTLLLDISFQKEEPHHHLYPVALTNQTKTKPITDFLETDGEQFFRFRRWSRPLPQSISLVPFQIRHMHLPPIPHHPHTLSQYLTTWTFHNQHARHRFTMELPIEQTLPILSWFDSLAILAAQYEAFAGRQTLRQLLSVWEKESQLQRAFPALLGVLTKYFYQAHEESTYASLLQLWKQRWIQTFSEDLGAACTAFQQTLTHNTSAEQAQGIKDEQRRFLGKCCLLFVFHNDPLHDKRVPYNDWALRALITTYSFVDPDTISELDTHHQQHIPAEVYQHIVQSSPELILQLQRSEKNRYTFWKQFQTTHGIQALFSLAQYAAQNAAVIGTPQSRLRLFQELLALVQMFSDEEAKHTHISEIITCFSEDFTLELALYLSPHQPTFLPALLLHSLQYSPDEQKKRRALQELSRCGTTKTISQLRELTTKLPRHQSFKQAMEETIEHIKQRIGHTQEGQLSLVETETQQGRLSQLDNKF